MHYNCIIFNLSLFFRSVKRDVHGSSRQAFLYSLNIYVPISTFPKLNVTLIGALGLSTNTYRRVLNVADSRHPLPNRRRFVTCRFSKDLKSTMIMYNSHETLSPYRKLHNVTKQSLHHIHWYRLTDITTVTSVST